MKFLFAILIFFVIHIQCFSQSVKPDSVIKADMLSGIQWQRWHSIDSLWLKYFFPSCLEENELKLSCATCGNIFLDAQLKIDSKGKLVDYKKIKGNICENDITNELEKCFLDYFYFMEFPPELRNMILEVKLGKSLKC
jgi:hypothetical protein